MAEPDFSAVAYPFDSVVDRDSILRGVDQTQMMLYGFANTLGELFGFDAIAEWGMDGVERNMREIFENPPQVESWDDVQTLSQAGTWFTERLGEQVPNLLTMLGGGGAATVAKAAIGKAIKRKIGFKAFEAGVLAGGTALNTGEAQIGLVGEGVDSPESALAAGVVKGALDSLLLGKAAQIAKAANVPTATVLGQVGQIGKEVLKTGAIEGSTEAAQTVVDFLAVKANKPEFDLFSSDNIDEILEAARVGAAVGGTVGGLANMASMRSDYNDASRQMDQMEGELDAAPDALPVFTPTVEREEEPSEESGQLPASTPIPEAQSVIDAQAAARSTVLSTQGSPAPQRGFGYTRSVLTEAGETLDIFTDDLAVAGYVDQRAYQQDTDTPLLTESDLGLLKYDRPEGKTGLDGTIITVRNAAGVPVEEVATGPDTIERDVENAQARMQEGETLELTDAQASLEERLERTTQEVRENSRVLESFGSREEAEAALEQLNPRANYEAFVDQQDELTFTLRERLVEPAERTETQISGVQGIPFTEQTKANPQESRSETELVSDWVTKITERRGNNKLTSGEMRARRRSQRDRARASLVKMKDAEGNPVPVTTEDLAALGQTLFIARQGVTSLELPKGGPAFQALAMEEALSELNMRGYDVSDALTDTGQIRPNLKINISSQKSSEQDVTFGQGRRQLVELRKAQTGSGQEFVEADLEKLDEDLRLAANKRDQAERIISKKIAEATQAGRDPATDTGVRFARTQYQKLSDQVGRLEATKTRQLAGPATTATEIGEQQEMREALELDRGAPRTRAGRGSPQNPLPDQDVEALTEEQGRRAGSQKERVDQRFSADVAPINSLISAVSANSQVTGLGGLTQTEVDFVESILREVGINDRIVIADTDLLLDQDLSAFGLDSELAQRELLKFASSPHRKATYLHPDKLTDGHAPVILVRSIENEANAPFRLLVLGHEAGHHVFKAAYNNLTSEIKKRIFTAFEKERDALGEAAPEQWMPAPGRNPVEEWFSDKVAARARDLTSQPKNILDKVFRDVALQLQKLWGAIAERVPARFTANKEFHDIVDQMKEADMFQGAPMLELRPDEVTDMYWDPVSVSRLISENALDKAIKAVIKGLRQSANKTVNSPIARYLFTQEGRLYEMGAAGRELARKLYTRSNEAVMGALPSLKSGQKFYRGVFEGRVQNALRMADEATVQEAFYMLATEADDVSSNVTAQAIRDVLNDLYEYITQVDPTIPYEKNYWHRDYYLDEISSRSEEFLDILAQHGVEGSADVMDAILSRLKDTSYEQTSLGSAGWQRERAIKDNPRLIQDLVDNGFLNADPHRSLLRYINSVVDRTEVGRRWGEMSMKTELDRNAAGDVIGERVIEYFDPVAGLEAEIARIEPARQAEARKLVEGIIAPGFLDPTVDWQRALMQIKAYESFRTLMFSGLASIPEVAGTFVRMKGEMGLNEYIGELRNTVKNWQDLHDLAEASGFINTAAGASMTTEMFVEPNSYKIGGPAKWLGELFKWNGTDFITNYSRVLSMQMGKKFLQQVTPRALAGDETALRYLAELGVQPDQVQALDAWNQNGQLHFQWGGSQESLVGTQALSMFLEQSVVHPNSAERPSWANHPVGAMVFHLKAFGTTYNKQILGGVWREIQNRPDAANLAQALPFMLGFVFVATVLGGIGDELRQRIKSLGSEGTFDRAHSPSDLLTTWFDRAGFISLPYIDVVQDIGAESVAYSAGPSVHHLYELMFKYYGNNDDAIKTLKLIPGFSQLPDARRFILENT